MFDFSGGANKLRYAKTERRLPRCRASRANHRLEHIHQEREEGPAPWRRDPVGHRIVNAPDADVPDQCRVSVPRGQGGLL